MVDVLLGLVRVEERVSDHFEARRIVEVGHHRQRLVRLHVQNDDLFVGLVCCVLEKEICI